MGWNIFTELYTDIFPCQYPAFELYYTQRNWRVVIFERPVYVKKGNWNLAIYIKILNTHFKGKILCIFIEIFFSKYKWFILLYSANDAFSQYWNNINCTLDKYWYNIRMKYCSNIDVFTFFLIFRQYPQPIFLQYCY